MAPKSARSADGTRDHGRVVFPASYRLDSENSASKANVSQQPQSSFQA